MSHDLIVRVVAKLLVAPILLFGLYVQFHGDFGPGGGFQAGVIFAAGFFLYGLVYGQDPVRRVLPMSVVRVGIALGVFLYIAVGVACLLLGGNFLDYDVLAADPVSGQHLGIFLVELGVGISVFSVMVAVFYAFSEHVQAE